MPKLEIDTTDPAEPPPNPPFFDAQRAVFWGTSEPRLLQSPPELGDLGGQLLSQRLFDLVLYATGGNEHFRSNRRPFPGCGSIGAELLASHVGITMVENRVGKIIVGRGIL
jgi:hypothetical protein